MVGSGTTRIASSLAAFAAIERGSIASERRVPVAPGPDALERRPI
jgi:hypothetical protein